MGKLEKYKQLAHKEGSPETKLVTYTVNEVPYGNTSRLRDSFIIITYYYPRAECKLKPKGQSPYQIVAKVEFR